MSQAQAFEPRLEALGEIVEFARTAFQAEGIDSSLLGVVDFVLEELFTNVVKYGATDQPVLVNLAAITGGVEVSLTASDVADFNPLLQAAPDTSLPLAQRQPGGLGLHLIRQLVDSIGYEYQGEGRRSRVTFRKTLA
jgi:serine/threonine-protein kinase RsbW